jgi:ubiquinone/menaquinone biosynthesis C-methylase UbiE
MDLLGQTRFRVGVFAGKLAVFVAGMVIMRYVRRAFFARLHGRSRNIYRKEVDNKKRMMFKEIHNLSNGDHTPLNIVEIGTGVVENVGLYPTNAEITCITTRVYREQELLSLAEEYPYVNIDRASSDAMTSLSDESIDVVVSILSLCTANDIEKTLAEIKRVLKKVGVDMAVQRNYFIIRLISKLDRVIA